MGYEHLPWATFDVKWLRWSLLFALATPGLPNEVASRHFSTMTMTMTTCIKICEYSIISSHTALALSGFLEDETNFVTCKAHALLPSKEYCWQLLA